MNPQARLTNRENQVAELSAWGACKKEIAIHLFISIRTVENHFRNIYEKSGCSKANELSAWWFCTRFRIPMSLSPLARKIAASIILAVYIQGAAAGFTDHLRVRSNTARIAVRSAQWRRNENNYQTSFAA